MFSLCIKPSDMLISTVIDLVYKYLSVTSDINKKCLIYSTSSNDVVLLLFTHITHNSDIILDNVDAIPTSDCLDLLFFYIDKIPSCDWNKFFYPYDCDPASIYDIYKLYISLQPDISTSTKIMSYVPSQVITDDIIAKIKYITRERLDTKAYDILQLTYPNIEPIKSTISEIREMSQQNNIYNILVSEDVTLDMASLVLSEYLSHRVVCSSVVARTIYIFTDIWHVDEGHAFLNRTMMYDVVNFLIRELNGYNCSDQINAISRYFSNNREDIIERLCYITESKSFLSLLDNKINTVATLDGLYDFDNDVFRSVRASDYVSISANVNYISNNIKYGREALISILSNFFPNRNILEFFLSTVALSLGGRNFEKIVVVWVGRTDSGKSTCQEFIEYVLGDYCGSVPSSMLTGKRSNPHGTTSAISSIGKKRLLFLQEPEESRINSSQLKSLSGNDSIYTREIYEKGTTMRIKAITTIVTNGRMDFSSCDEAALSRIVVIPFISKFVTSRERHKHSNSSNIVDADPNISNKLRDLATPMINILIDKYRIYLREGYKIPTIIRDYTNEFISNSNPTLYYMKNYTEHRQGARIQISVLFSLFSAWYRETYPGNRLIPLYSFRETIISSGYSIVKEFVIDYCLTS